MLIMVSYDEPVVTNHGLLCCAKGCESWRVILSQWLRIMVCYAEPVVVNHGVLCKWLLIMVCYAEPVVVKHGVLY